MIEEFFKDKHGKWAVLQKPNPPIIIWFVATIAAKLSEQGIEPEKSPYSVRAGGSLICFVRDPDNYRIELIES